MVNAQPKRSTDDAADKRSAPVHLGVGHNFIQKSEGNADNHKWQSFKEQASHVAKSANAFSGFTEQDNTRDQSDRPQGNRRPILDDAAEPASASCDAPNII